MRHKLIKAASFSLLMAEGYEVEGTDRYVLELLMHGFAYASCFVLLKSAIVLRSAEDEAVIADIGRHPSKFGKVLQFDRDLFLNKSDGVLYIEL